LVEELEAYRQQHTQATIQRLGRYTRRVLTSHGFIPDLHVPKLRAGNADRSWQMLTRYQQAMPLVLDQARAQVRQRVRFGSRPSSSRERSTRAGPRATPPVQASSWHAIASARRGRG
jgi:hypothetical protein